MTLNAQHIVAWIAVFSALAGGVAKFVSLDEAKTNAQTVLQDHGRRIDSIERDTTTVKRFSDLQLSIEKLQWKVDALSEQIAAEKKHGR